MKKKTKVLFIDRDGTLILEPEDYQVDSLDKLNYYPGVFTNLSRIANELNFKLVMVTNQDGLGTDSFPESDFWPVHNKMLKTLEGEGILFDEVLIDRSFPADQSPNRKPRTGLLTHYFTEEYDQENSFVIGDRSSDMELATNLGCKGILIGNFPNEKAPEGIAFRTDSWSEIYQFLRVPDRKSNMQRNTNETKIEINLNLDGTGESNNETGIGFFDHMLDQLARHGGLDLSIKVDGDLHVDEHHTIEDTGIVLGEAFNDALGDKRGIERYGFTLPMDDCLAQVAIDFGGRSWLVWDAEFNREMIGQMPTEMFSHFFKSFCDGSQSNLNIKAEGSNEHHKIEAIFKAFARAIKSAVRKDQSSNQLPTTKGTL